MVVLTSSPERLEAVSAKIRNVWDGFRLEGRRGYRIHGNGLVPEGQHDRSQARSAWDSATPKEPSRRVRSDSGRCARRFNDWSDGISKAKPIKVKLYESFQETVYYIE
jgi:hypothetical protein